jgi:hypothetical protein
MGTSQSLLTSDFPWIEVKKWKIEKLKEGGSFELQVGKEEIEACLLQIAPLGTHIHGFWQ